tara:strand:- start:181 stop:543 length:363 start_codon:yes stop_codon:yes gene_type:complete
MIILANPIRVIFFFYLVYIFYGYTRQTPSTSYVEQVADLVTDYTIHFAAFFILGVLAQLSNNKSNDFILGISLALITSVFIEFIHAFLPYRSFEIMEGIFNVLGCLLGIYLISYIKSKYV